MGGARRRAMLSVHLHAVKTMAQTTMPEHAPVMMRFGHERLGRWAQFGADLGVTLVVVAVYFLARGAAPQRIDAALATTDRIIDIERALGVFVEPRIQQLSIQDYWLQEAANFTYVYLHFPVLAIVGVWLWWRHGRERFLLVRNAMFISMLIGLVFYYLLPAAPPRLLALNGTDLGFIDTVFGGNTAVSYAQPALLRNDYAAIPSFHFGWIMLAAMAVWSVSSSRALRALAVGLTVLMTWAIVATANHFFLDMVLGGAVIALSWWLALRISLLTRQTAPTALPSTSAQERVAPRRTTA